MVGISILIGFINQLVSGGHPLVLVTGPIIFTKRKLLDRMWEYVRQNVIMDTKWNARENVKIYAGYIVRIDAR